MIKKTKHQTYKNNYWIRLQQKHGYIQQDATIKHIVFGIQNNKMVIDSAKMLHWQCLNRIPLSSIDNKHNNYPLAVVLAPLVEQLLPTQEICGLNPDIGKFYLPSTGKKI